MAVKIFMDCGAFSLYQKLGQKVAGRKKSRHDSFDYVKTEAYLKYRQDYADFIKEHGDTLDAYPNLDVIYSAELTWENHQWMLAQGINPLPVWHLGSDVKWLRKYLKMGAEYICIGGLQAPGKAALRPALDHLWRTELTDGSGMPVVKVHGFAMTGFDLMYRYPWYSVDSKSWIDTSSFGGILVPFMKNGKRDWLHPRKIPMTAQSRHYSNHYLRSTEGVRRYIRRFLKEMDVPLGKSKNKKVKHGYELKKGEAWIEESTERKRGRVEVPIKPGVRNHYVYRNDLNMLVFRKIEAIIPEWPWALSKKIKRGRKGLLS